MPVTCFVSYEIHPTTAGGAGVLIHHAAELLLRQGHRVVLLLDIAPDLFAKFRDGDAKNYGTPDRVAAYRVDELCGDYPHAEADIPCIFQWKSSRFAHALRKVVEIEHPDFFEFFEYCGPGYYAFVRRVFDGGQPPPVLGARVHGSIEVLDRHGKGRLNDADQFMLHSFEHRALALCESVLVPTRTYYERYYREQYALEPARVVVSSPPKEHFPRTTRRPRPGDHFSIAFIGRMFHLKGVDQLVHAAVMLMKRRPDLAFRVDLMGYDSPNGPLGSYTAYLRSLIPTRLRGRFAFTGQVTHEAIAERLNDALFAVFPNRVESFCYALHEVYDAGVPVLINDLPAFADFFVHGKNAWVYDGTTGGLLAGMERLIDDHGTREALCRPYAVAEHPIGEFYNAPKALRAMTAAGPVPSPLVVILACDGDPTACPALAAIRAQTAGVERVVCLVPSPPDGEETLWWLGKGWHVRSAEGTPIEASDVLTTDALLVLRGDDRPGPEWMALCLGALSRRADMAFAGTWAVRGGCVQPGIIDLAPELHPFQRGEELARVLVRTQPGVPLTDLFDASLGGLGHTGYLWGAIARWGHGCLLDEPLMTTSDAPARADPAVLKSLVMRFGSPFAERLALLTGVLADRPDPAPTPPEPITLEHKIRAASELGGGLLARMAWGKLKRRVRGNGKR